jgi:hypothetical protein
VRSGTSAARQQASHEVSICSSHAMIIRRQRDRVDWVLRPQIALSERNSERDKWNFAAPETPASDSQ